MPSNKPITGLRRRRPKHRNVLKIVESNSNASQKNSLFYTDLYEVYKKVVPNKDVRRPQYQRSRTHHVERLNGALRSKISRLVEKSYFFAESIDAFIASGGLAVYHYNLSF